MKPWWRRLPNSRAIASAAAKCSCATALATLFAVRCCPDCRGRCPRGGGCPPRAESRGPPRGVPAPLRGDPARSAGGPGSRGRHLRARDRPPRARWQARPRGARRACSATPCSLYRRPRLPSTMPSSRRSPICAGDGERGLEVLSRLVDAALLAVQEAEAAEHAALDAAVAHLAGDGAGRPRSSSRASVIRPCSRCRLPRLLRTLASRRRSPMLAGESAAPRVSHVRASSMRPARRSACASVSCAVRAATHRCPASRAPACPVGAPRANGPWSSSTSHAAR